MLVVSVDLDVGIGVVLGGFLSVNPRDIQARHGGTVGKLDLTRHCHPSSSVRRLSGSGTAHISSEASMHLCRHNEAISHHRFEAADATTQIRMTTGPDQ